MRKSIAPLMLAIMLTVAQAGATVVTSISGGTVIPIPTVDCSAPLFSCFGPGPSTFGPGITWTSTNAFNGGGAVFGYTGAFPFGGNGMWTGALGTLAGLNDSTASAGSTDTMTFAFSTPISAVGGFLNYAPGGSTPTMIAVYDSHGNLIEPAFSLNFSTTGADQYRFYGFKEPTPDISSFVLTDNYIAITQLTISSAPEPNSILLLGSGLLGAITYGRKRFRL